MTPKALIRTARNHFFFAVILWAAAKNDLLEAHLPDRVSWTNDAGETRTLDWQKNKQRVATEAVNNMRSALGVAIIQLDKVLADHFVASRYKDPDPERRAARCAVYMLRCAFAHNPLEPTWNVTRAEYAQKFVIPAAGFSIDTTTAHGKPLDSTGLNWFGLLDLFDYCASLVP